MFRPSLNGPGLLPSHHGFGPLSQFSISSLIVAGNRKLSIVPQVKSLAAFAAQLSFFNHPSKNLRRAKSLRAERAMKVLGNVESDVEADKVS